MGQPSTALPSRPPCPCAIRSSKTVFGPAGQAGDHAAEVVAFDQGQIGVAPAEPVADHRRFGAAAGDEDGIGAAVGLGHGFVRQLADLRQQWRRDLGLAHPAEGHAQRLIQQLNQAFELFMLCQLDLGLFCFPYQMVA